MFRAIIVDDENKICLLIRKLGEWDRLCIEVVDICHNGEAALKSIELHEPDIVITDIRMPDFDGLDLISKVKGMGINSAFVIISGYRHFEYAHNAMKVGVHLYMKNIAKK